MRHALLFLLLPGLALLAGCGGGGTDRLPQVSDSIDRLNEHELRLQGAYELDGFMIRKAGEWTTGDQVEGWSGTLFLAYDQQVSLEIELEGELRMLTGRWSADGGYITFDGEAHGPIGHVAAWALTDDGILQTTFMQSAGGAQTETWLWRRAGS